jgi:hypothetical protein
MRYSLVLGAITLSGVTAAPTPQAGDLGALLGGLGGVAGGNAGGFSLWDIIKNIPGPDLRFLSAIFHVPNIEKYVPTYLDWRNISTVPFIGPLAFGPAPTGCNKYEILIGRISFLIGVS